MVIVVIARELFACKLLHITRLDEIRCVRKYYPLESAKSNDIQQISLNEAKKKNERACITKCSEAPEVRARPRSPGNRWCPCNRWWKTVRERLSR